MIACDESNMKECRAKSPMIRKELPALPRLEREMELRQAEETRLSKRHRPAEK